MLEAIKSIEGLGPGCPRCQETYRVVRHVVEAAGLSCQVIKQESIDHMIELGVVATPAVVVDGKVVLFGWIPRAPEIQQLLGIQ